MTGSFIPAFALIALVWLGASCTGFAQTRQALSIRGRQQTVYVYGRPTNEPIVVSSGDGGWMHLGPHVAEVLAARGFFVVGFDVKSYLSSFTSGHSTLDPEDEPGDYRALAEFAASGSGRKPILIGISEGAGLSLLAATDPRTKAVIAGVIGLGLPDRAEMGWRWKDALIYLTHRAPNEPFISAAAIAEGVAPLPLGAIHSTEDEFVPVKEVEAVLHNAREPKRLWIVKATNHRFSSNLAEFDRRLVEAIDWVRQNTPR